MGEPSDVLALALLNNFSQVTWERVAAAIPVIKNSGGARTFVGSRGSSVDTTFTDEGEDAAGYGFPPPLSYVFNLSNIAEGGGPIADGRKYLNSSGMAEGLVGGHLPIVVYYFPVSTESPYLPPTVRGQRYWTMVACGVPDMQGSREQGVWFRFQQIECRGAHDFVLGKDNGGECALMGRPQYYDTFWWSNSPSGGNSSKGGGGTGPAKPASAAGFYQALLATRAWWEDELAAERMMAMELPSPASTNGTFLHVQALHNLIRGMITWQDTWGPRCPSSATIQTPFCLRLVPLGITR